MVKVTELQAQKRFLTIPETLQDAIFSEQITQIIEDVSDRNHLNYDRADKLANFVGLVLLGFIHPEDLEHILREELMIPPQVATDVASALSTKVFNNLRGDLDKAYAPVPENVPEAPAVGPKILEDVEEVAPVGAKLPQPPTPAPKAAFGEGWSKMPHPASPSTPANVPTQANAMPRPTIVGDLQKTGMGKISIPLPTPPVSAKQSPAAPAPAAPAPMPVFMKNDSATMPIAKAPDLSTKSVDKIASMTEIPKPVSRPAVIEFGSSPSMSNLPQSKPQEKRVPVIVDYAKSSPEKGRQVTELTNEAPKAPPPPAPMPAVNSSVPPIPKPPAPPVRPATGPASLPPRPPMPPGQ